MHYSVDRNGNQWAWLGAPARGSVVVGSHLDSVPNGGAFDGPLGIVSAFLAIDNLRARGVVPVRSIAVVNFIDEEGARFGLACAGSRLLTGLVEPKCARSLSDRDGVSMAEAMMQAGVDPAGIGPDPIALEQIGVYVELHIEQGRMLTGLGAPMGVASAIWPHGRWRYRYAGRADHAGTTKLKDRCDPMLPFASTVLAARDLAEAGGAVATFARVTVEPNATNAIPSRVDAWLDARAPQDETVTRLVSNVTAAAESFAEPHGVEVEVTPESFSPVVVFGEGLRDRIGRVLGDVPVLATGAGHDAGILSAYVPSAMLFVRNHTGVSHSPDEAADLNDCLVGVAALTEVLVDLANEPA
jgi:N-carbamoyl-L-amino-acid hydrolase